MIKPYLMFNRQCDEAFHLYKQAFAGEFVSFQKYGDMPPNPDFPVPEGDRDLVLHAELKLGEAGTIFGSDGKHATEGPGVVGISVELDCETLARSAWDVLKADGTAKMELQPTFFAKLHGSITDKFGVSWIFTVN